VRAELSRGSQLEGRGRSVRTQTRPSASPPYAQEALPQAREVLAENEMFEARV